VIAEDLRIEQISLEDAYLTLTSNDHDTVDTRPEAE